jgi:hypothetical protein
MLIVSLLAFATFAAFAQEQQSPRLTPRFLTKPASGLNVEKLETELHTNGFSSMSSLPLWVYSVDSARDGNQYSGVIVGASPFTHGGQKNINVQGYVIPLIIVTNSIATSLDFNTGEFTTVPGVVTFDSTQSTGCLTAPNNIPSRLLAQSPIFNSVDYAFGGTSVGSTQYVDAFQRGNFWAALGANNIRQDYHLRLNPVRFLNPIVINVPAANGVAITDPLLFGPPPICPPMALIDVGWLDAYLQDTVIPQLAFQGVGPSNLPMFLSSNVQMYPPPLNFYDCCYDGYHASNDSTPIQTYVVADFDSSQFYTPPGNLAVDDTGAWSHEVAEWVNNPIGDIYSPGLNLTPAWGHTGQVAGCQANMEVGDPLTFTAFPAVTMSNGFTYHLQELAFFSWFYGGDSLGANGWYSDNGTFLTDAGPVCQ